MANDVDPRFDPLYQRGYDGPVVEAHGTGGPLAEPTETGGPLVAGRTPDTGLVDGLESESHRNPWLVALWVVAALLTIGGIAAQYLSQQLLQGRVSNSAFDYYVVPATIAALAPWFVGAGLFSGVAALVLSAIRWRPVAE